MHSKNLSFCFLSIIKNVMHVKFWGFFIGNQTNGCSAICVVAVIYVYAITLLIRRRRCLAHVEVKLVGAS